MKQKRLLLGIMLALLIVTMTVQAGAVGIHGDFTEDGKIGSKDALYLLRHVLNPGGYPIDQCGDMNGDGKVNSQDAIYLLRHVLNPAGYPVVASHTAVAGSELEPTCTENGHTAGSYCAVCEAVLEEQQLLPATGHNYVDGQCEDCGQADPDADFEFVLNEAGTGYILISAAGCTDAHITVPDTYQDLPVVQIAYRAFSETGTVCLL